MYPDIIITFWALFDLHFFDSVILYTIAYNGCTPARAALRWLLRVGLGRHGRECVVLTIYFIGFQRFVILY